MFLFGQIFHLLKRRINELIENMKENTNKIIVVNTVFLYIKLIVTTITGLLTTRFALKALGVDDYGLYAVLGGIVSIISIINSIMILTSNRFIAVAIGKGNLVKANEQFNVNLLFHIAFAIITLIIIFPIGNWYIPKYVNYSGDINVALLVFYWSVVGSTLSFIGVPYHGLLMAREKFIVFSLIDIISSVLKMLMALSLIFYFTDKLIVYAISMAVLTAYPTGVYIAYCYRHYRDIVRLKFIKKKSKYKEVFIFSFWEFTGAAANTCKTQGAALLVNAFFNTAMNTAMGLANTVKHFISMFEHNLTRPMSPQITKNYASGNMERCNNLVIMCTKVSFLMMLFMSVPFLIETEWIFNLWLGSVPPYAVVFTKLLIIEGLINSMNEGIMEIVFATGKIALYQILVNTSRVLAIVAAYIALRMGAPAEALFYSYIAFAVVIFFMKQIALNKTVHFDNGKLFKRSYLPSLIVVALFLPCFFIHSSMHPILHLSIIMLYLLALIYFIGLRKEEKIYVNKLITHILHIQ